LVNFAWLPEKWLSNSVEVTEDQTDWLYVLESHALSRSRQMFNWNEILQFSIFISVNGCPNRPMHYNFEHFTCTVDLSRHWCQSFVFICCCLFELPLLSIHLTITVKSSFISIGSNQSEFQT
jgi:hypothetical protein